jgi:hypothetical protein
MNPNPNPFIDFDQLLLQIEEVHMSEEILFGECDTCDAIYETYSRDGRCGECPYCADCCDHPVEMFWWDL